MGYREIEELAEKPVAAVLNHLDHRLVALEAALKDLGH
jgi:hypothetical protein